MCAHGLGVLVLPVEVRLENRSGRPLKVQLQAFALVGEARHEALSEAAMEQVLSATGEMFGTLSLPFERR